MAHEIIRNSDYAEVRARGERAWHGLGTVIPAGLTAVEGLDACDALNWEPQKAPLTCIYEPAGEAPVRIEVPGKVAIVRDDTREVLGVRSEKYRLLGNRELCEIADSILGEDVAMQVETMGALQGGKRVFVLMRLPSAEVADGDEVRPYICLGNSHNGKQPLTITPTEIRVVCANTFAWANDKAHADGRLLTIRHDRSMCDKIEQAKVVLGRGRKIIEQMITDDRAMARLGLGRDDAGDFFRRVYIAEHGNPERKSTSEAREKARERMNETVDRWFALWLDQRHKTVRSVRHTAWDALNVVTEHNDFFRGAGKPKRRELTTARINSNLFGASAVAKSRARRIALSMIS